MRRITRTVATCTSKTFTQSNTHDHASRADATGEIFARVGTGDDITYEGGSHTTLSPARPNRRCNRSGAGVKVKSAADSTRVNISFIRSFIARVSTLRIAISLCDSLVTKTVATVLP